MKTPERIYCLARCADGRWLLLNRNYKPYRQQFTRDDWVDYETCPGIRLWLTDRHLQQLSGGCVPYRAGDRQVWLHHDGSQPDQGAAHLAAYVRRLAVLDDLLEWAS